ncbi:hypothetical protein [Streptomyces sp. NBC_01244]|uniref:hypothetical protein n=1 Tax=Streptomyces sp. NBC_01244 TaxID=2903797 RepID=UPI002E162377|nr:hypothetical protein OG247_41445 [Streptomyces sp. NBC_01244]
MPGRPSTGLPGAPTALAAELRQDQLLFGTQRTPKQLPGTGSPAADTVADAGGVGALAATAYRLSPTGWQMAGRRPLGGPALPPSTCGRSSR